MLDYTRAPGRPGLLYDLNPTTIDTYSSTSRINIGTLMVRSPGPGRNVKAPTAVGDVVAGSIEAVAVLGTHGSSISDGDGLYLPSYPPGKAISGLIRGRVWVRVDEDVERFGTITIRVAQPASGTDDAPNRGRALTRGPRTRPEASDLEDDAPTPPSALRIFGAFGSSATGRVDFSLWGRYLTAASAGGLAVVDLYIR